MCLCLRKWLSGLSLRSSRHLLHAMLMSCMICSCESIDRRRVQELEFRISQDSLLMAGLHAEMDEINDLLSQAEHLNAFLGSQESITKQTAISKIRRMEELLSLSYKRMDSLEAAIKKSSSPLRENAVVRNSIALKRNEVAFANDYYQQLELNVRMLTGQNINLARALKERDLTLAERDKTIEDLSYERRGQNERLNELTSKIAEAERNLRESEQTAKVQKLEIMKERADFYYSTGVEMREMFDDSGKFGTRRTRKELINKAYAYLKKARELGHIRAPRVISELESDRRYSRFLD